MRKLLSLLALVLAAGCDDVSLNLPTPTPAPAVSVTAAPTPTTNSCPMPSQAPNGATWSVHFSPRGGSTTFLVQAINNANESIYVQAYSFTSTQIANALILKKRQGKIVEVILDKSDLTGKGSVIHALLDNGVTVYIDDKHAIAHNKVMIIDRKIVFTGSFNFTRAAEENNAENSIELTDPKLADVYRGNWDFHKQHSYIQNL